MTNDVSRLRRQKTRTRSREKKHEPIPVPFKNSRALARLYQFAVGVVCLALFAAPFRQPLWIWLLRTGAVAIAIALVFVCLRLMLDLLAPTLFDRNSRVFLVLLLLVSGVALARGFRSAGVLWQWWPNHDVALFLLPHTFVPMVLTLLLGPAVSLSTGLGLSLLTAWIWDGSPIVLLLGIVTTVVVTHGAGEAHRRSRILRVGLAAGAVQLTGVLLMMIYAPQGPMLDWPLALWRSLASIGGALGGALLALAALPVIERLFALTSNITLAGFSDLGHPLLQRLALQAPGSYHHSLVVAMLAQAAALRIGANGLLARVCGYYHDIGKLEKPTFFIENVMGQRNPHDDLAPNISRMIIANHVKEGVSLGLLHKLPPPIMEVIREHHGTSLIRCFHHKAKTKKQDESAQPGDSAGDAAAAESHYRYGGPTPETKVSGILCLADSIEAASRSLERASPTHIDGLVNDIVDRKIADGQLSRCALTLSEITQIKRTFVSSLRSMLHARIAYPENENSRQQPAATSPD